MFYMDSIQLIAYKNAIKYFRIAILQLQKIRLYLIKAKTSLANCIYKYSFTNSEIILIKVRK